MARQITVVPLEFAERPALELRATAERIRVVPVEAGQSPRIEVENHRRDGAALKLEREGETLLITTDGARAIASWVFGSVPFAQLTLFVPENVRAKIRQDFGTLEVERLVGCDLELSASAGTIYLNQLRGRMQVSVDSGTIKGDHLAGTFNVRTSAGSVKLGVDALDAGEHRFTTELGSVKLFLAPGQQVKFDSVTSLGSSRISYPSVEGAPAHVKLSAELGSIRVKEGEEFVDERHGDWADWRRVWHDAVATVGEVISDAAPKPKAQPVPEAELRKVLELLQDGKINAQDAERLIRAMGR